jgi:hypothetical protein
MRPNSEVLADRLQKAGLPAVYNARLALEDPAVRPGNVYISVFGDGPIPYSVTGLVDNPIGAPFPFVANWWYSGKHGRIRMSTNIPGIAFGAAGLVLRASTESMIGQLIGGNTKADFTAFNVRGVFANATMAVTTSK